MLGAAFKLLLDNYSVIRVDILL